MRIAFFGSDAIAVPALNYLRWAEGVELVGVVSQPDRPAGRGRHLHTNAVSAWAIAHGIPLLQPEKPGAEEEAWLRGHRVDIALVMAYGHILRRALLDSVPRGMWNLHASLLPTYRGASPVETVLASGEKETGVTLMGMVEQMDAGSVAGMERVPILSTDTGPILRNRLAEACVPLLQRHLRVLVDGTIKLHAQDEAKASYTRKLTKADGQADFTLSAVELERRLRAWQPWPGMSVEHHGQVLKMGAAMVVAESAEGVPGTILRANENGVDVATGMNVLRIQMLQRPGGRMLPVAEFLRGYHFEIGECLPSRPQRPLVSPKPFPRAAFF